MSDLPVWGIVGLKGSEIFSCEGAAWEWARCHYGACENFVCDRLSPIHCWVHADGQPTGAEFLDKLTERTPSFPELAEAIERLTDGIEVDLDEAIEGEIV